MLILGIETSCDETAGSVAEGLTLQGGVKILSSITATSAGIHARTGGVIPEAASRKQIEAIIPVIDLALKEAKLSSGQIDTLAVTSGPGLIGSLLVGVETAKTLAFLWKKAIIPVNHLVGHIYANWLIKELKDRKTKKPKNSSGFLVQSSSFPQFPALALVVSGGHTDLVLMKDHGNLEWIGGTRDDAAGEAFDKTARLLGLPYPGGPNLSKIADDYIKKHPLEKLNLFPRPMVHEDNFDWSFSGLKTAVLNEVKKASGNDSAHVKLSDYEKFFVSGKSKSEIPKLAAEIQEAIVDSLIKKSVKAIIKYKPKSFLLAGGVAANTRLREKFQKQVAAENIHIDFRAPVPPLCTDNAAYIAACAYYNYKPVDWKKITANPELTITSEL